MRLTAFSTGCLRTSSRCWMKPIAITPAASRRSAASAIRTRWMMCARDAGSWCCALSPSPMDWLECGLAMDGPGGADGIFARLKPAFMVSSLAEAGTAALADTRPHSASVRDECRRSKGADPGHLRDGNSRNSHVDEFPFLPGWRRCGRPLPGTARGRHHRSSHEWIVGSADAFRVTIGTPEQNQQFLGALKRAVSGPGVAVISLCSRRNHHPLPT